MPVQLVRLSRLAGILCCCALVLAMMGCGGDSKAGAVTGVVTLDGKTVTEGEVTFTPMKTGQPQTSAIQPDGSYRLENLPAGDAIVTVKGPQSGADNTVSARMKGIKESVAAGKGSGKPAAAAPPKGESLPAKYADGATSDLRYTVKSGENKFDIPLKK